MAVLKDLIVHGASRFINVVQFDSTKGGIIAADKGVFNKLIATDAEIGTLDVDELNANTLTAQKATVVGLLDVKGELHTNQWTNANISNVGGSFYISPTVGTTIASNGTPMNITITGNANDRTVQVSGGAFVTDAVKIYSGNQTSTASWAIGSHVMFTGTVRLSTSSVDYPLGTCVGYLTAALSSSGFTVGEVSSAALETIISELGTSNLKSYDIKISMFEIGPKATIKPVGIMMTSYGLDKSTYLDIYGGVNVKNSTTGKVNPNLRIGYLGGLDSYTDSAGVSHQPVGWGIYTDNGYFTGTIIADSGTIGGYAIGTNDLTKGATRDANGSFWITPAQSSNSSMANLATATWAITTGRNFGVTTAGVLYASGANVSGTITATSGAIGGFNLNANEFYYGGAAPGTQEDTFVIYPTGTESNQDPLDSTAKMYIVERIISNNQQEEQPTTEPIEWALTIGRNFGVDIQGTLYANDAHINGTLTIGEDSAVTGIILEEKINDISDQFQAVTEEVIKHVNDNIDLINDQLTILNNKINSLVSVQDVTLLSLETLSEVTIGQSEYYSIGVGNNRISFNTLNYQEFGYLTSEKMFLNKIELTDEISIANTLVIGNFQWVNRNGRLTLMKI